MPCGETSSAHDVVPIYARIHAHSAAKIRRQIRSLSLWFFVTRRLGIYCFNLPWLCLIMESSFWPAQRQRVARPLKQTFLCLCFTEVKRCSANRLWIRTMLSLRCCNYAFEGLFRWCITLFFIAQPRNRIRFQSGPKILGLLFGESFTVEKSIWPSISWLRLDTSTATSIIRSQFRKYLNFVIIIIISWLTLHRLRSTHWSASVNKCWNRSS